MPVLDTNSAARSVHLTLRADLVDRAQAEGLDLSALAEAAIASALSRRARPQVTAAEIEQACRAHDQYLAEYGSLAEAVRLSGNADE